MRDRCGILLQIACAATLGTTAFAADVVYVAPADPGRAPQQRPGEIVDLTGRSIRLRATSGLLQQIETRRVLRVETSIAAQQQAADEAARRGDWDAAVANYRKALRAEPRVWVRRRILADLVACETARDRFDAAADGFLLLWQSDPTTPFFDVIPLAWSPGAAVSRQKAEGWLAAQADAAHLLLGASHLMATSKRPMALDALRRLATNDDPRIAALAEAQQWRAALVGATAERLGQWASRVEHMPESVRAGPYFMLGRGWLRAGRPRQAVLALLKPPILYPRQQRLAAESLVLAAEALTQQGQREAADRLLAEVQRKYGRAPRDGEVRMKNEGGERKQKTEGGKRTEENYR